METDISKHLRQIFEPSYIKECPIGRGTFGKVYKCKNSKTNVIFAVKEIEKNDFNLKSILAEINVIKNIPVHRRLVTFYGITNECKYIKIFTEFMSKGSLRDFIDKNGMINEDKASLYVRQVVEGIDFLHDNKVIHRDIKCGNILLDDEDRIKLTDFGLSKIVDDNCSLENHTNCGTSYFMAPELLLKKNYNFSVDIWALGVTIVEMLTGEPIYFKLNGGPFIQKVTTEKIEWNIPNCSKKLSYFLKLTFISEPISRPSTKDLLKTEFINLDNIG